MQYSAEQFFTDMLSVTKLSVPIQLVIVCVMISVILISVMTQGRVSSSIFTNIRLGWQWPKVTSTQAYDSLVLIIAAKSF